MKWMLALMTALAIGAANAGTASGSLIVDGKTTELRFAYAYQVKGGVDNKQRDTLLVISAEPLPESLISSDLEDVDLLGAGIRGLIIEIPAAAVGESFSRFYVAHLRILEARNGSTLEQFELDRLPSLSDSHIAAHFKGQIFYSTMVPLDSREATYDVRIEANVVPFAEDSAPLRVDAGAAGDSAPGRAFLKFLEAAATREFDEMADYVTTSLAQRLKDPYFWDSVSNRWNYFDSKLTNPRLLNVTETGDSAVLIASGTKVKSNRSIDSEDRVEMEGKVWMQKVDGRWLVRKYIWRDPRGIPPPPPPPPAPPRPPQIPPAP